MVYFIILFFYFVALAASLVGGVLLRFTRFKAASPYVIGAALGTAPGLVAANALLWLALSALLEVEASGHQVSTGGTSTGLSIMGVVAVAGAMVLVPIVVTGVGIITGAVGGMYVAWRLRRGAE